MVIKEYMAQYDAIEIEIEQIRKEIKKTEDFVNSLMICMYNISEILLQF